MKVCIKCKVKKEKSEFYPTQGDCKDCVKARVKARTDILKQDPEWLEKERLRGREKYHRLGCKKPSPSQKKKAMDTYIAKFPEKAASRSMSSHLKPQVKGNHLHHWSYNDEHFKSVIELSVSDHNLLHRYIIYDQERRMYRNLQGSLLDTKESHIEIINELRKTNERVARKRV